MFQFAKFFCLLLGVLTLNAACLRRVDSTPLTKYTPIFIKKSILVSSIKLNAPTVINEIAKIYISGNYIYISEKYKGVHVIDNSNPSNPVKKAFLTIPGCVDIAVKNDALYADNTVDLICIDLIALQNGHLNIVKRLSDVFPELAPPDGGRIPTKFNKLNRPENSIIAGWRLENE